MSVYRNGHMLRVLRRLDAFLNGYNQPMEDAKPKQIVKFKEYIKQTFSRVWKLSESSDISCTERRPDNNNRRSGRLHSGMHLNLKNWIIKKNKTKQEPEKTCTHAHASCSHTAAKCWT